MSFDAIPYSEQDIIQSLGAEFSVEGTCIIHKVNSIILKLYSY